MDRVAEQKDFTNAASTHIEQDDRDPSLWAQRDVSSSESNLIEILCRYDSNTLLSKAMRPRHGVGFLARWIFQLSAFTFVTSLTSYQASCYHTRRLAKLQEHNRSVS